VGPTAQQHNERIKTIIAVLSNGGLALIAAFAAVIYNGQGTAASLAMVFAGIMLICFALIATRLLREEA